jgi:hypothetical protein
MKKRILSILLIVIMSCSLAAQAAGTGFADVPAGDWSEAYISKAVELGVMNGYGGNVFGYGNNVKRSEFAAMLVRLFKWTLVYPDTPSFADNADKNAWYYDEIETAVANGAVLKDGQTFRPDDYITREEMAVMLVRGLGYATLAGSLSGVETPFTDVYESKSSIAMAYDFGIINGTTATTFSPDQNATREQAAAMMIRLNDRYYAKTDWLHAFYAGRSYPQKDSIPVFDAVSFGWSSLTMSADGAPALNMTSEGGNTFVLPDGYGEVIDLADSANVTANLNVYMSESQEVTLPDGTVTDPCSAILLNPDMRSIAVTQIASQLVHGGTFSGVTIDFEEMSGEALKDGLNLFLEELSAETQRLGVPLYVCVPPVTSDGIFFDAYDYRTIGAYADKVILMAHNYAAAALTVSDMNAGFTTTPPTPIYEIYHALKAMTDSETGVSDKGKIALAVSIGSTQWKTKDGKVVNETAYHPDPSAIYSRMLDPAASLNYSEKYQNPYITYHNTTDGTDNIAWYEDERSVSAKAELARMFGIDGLSVWRLGLIPAYADTAEREIHYDILGWLEELK